MSLGVLCLFNFEIGSYIQNLRCGVLGWDALCTVWVILDFRLVLYINFIIILLKLYCINDYRMYKWCFQKSFYYKRKGSSFFKKMSVIIFPINVGWTHQDIMSSCIYLCSASPLKAQSFFHKFIPSIPFVLYWCNAIDR